MKEYIVSYALAKLIEIVGAVTAVSFLLFLIALMAFVVFEDVRFLAKAAIAAVRARIILFMNDRFANKLFHQVEEFRRDFS